MTIELMASKINIIINNNNNNNNKFDNQLSLLLTWLVANAANTDIIAKTDVGYGRKHN